MEKQSAEFIDKIRQQFETSPYPRIPLETSAKKHNKLYIHNLITAYYLRNQQVIDNENKAILDAGCGSGYTSLILAEANPGAKIVGIDISEESIKLARKRLQYHGFDKAEFYALSIDEIPSLGIEFDYINNDEVLYLLPDPVAGLQAMKSVLKRDGIIRTNLHSALERVGLFRAQEVFKMMELMDANPGKDEIELVRETMRSLKDDVLLKQITWRAELEKDDEMILMNHLLQGDKGYSIPEMFSALRAADLEFVSMVDWRSWELMDLFKEPDNLPIFLGLTLPEISIEQRLHLFDLLHPAHRLLDFWCGHPSEDKSFVPVAEWTTEDWLQVGAHLHPQLRTQTFKEDLIARLNNSQLFEMNRHLSVGNKTLLVESTMASCLLPLLEGAQSAVSLAKRYHSLSPLQPVTLEPISEPEAMEAIASLLSRLESFGYVLLERLPPED
ncbi:class I SAM-dependent methyltransferase [Microcoleus sp. FACHB-831]|uniref:class I SAM-dependent methyltransferase n=1 Tax=Microcoleus sp. FACHB-831 TaxID=2692827 RepID=UPI00168A0332|nr:methyltransferase domain-containing protein [Microcoleus sp. FACHB-831]MBD1921229.1 class I SAM-dependent methyltransferase [Microcoleus sp. FACHB-831]